MIKHFFAKPRAHVLELVEYIEANPSKWGATDEYFFNNEERFVFWVSCGWAQFSCVADRHIATRGFTQIPLNSKEKALLHRTYKKWKAIRVSAIVRGYSPDIKMAQFSRH